MQIKDWLKETGARLERAGVEAPGREAEWLLALGLDKTRGWVLAHAEEIVPVDRAPRLEALVAKRGARVPFAHLRGTQEFMGLEFVVSPAVLIPRPDTELLVEIAAALLPGLAAPEFFEVGLGSGCVAISLLKQFPDVRAAGSELSAAAVRVARQNAAALGVDARLEILSCDLFPAAGRKWPLILSNPPYIPTAEIATLAPEVRDHEPRGALDGGADGLDFYRRLLAESPAYLTPDGRLLIEHGAGQRPALRALAAAQGFTVHAEHDDLAGLPRVMVLS